MAFEVELKVHVPDPISLKHTLEQQQGISEALCEEKDDIYYAREGEDPLFRLRAEKYGSSFTDLHGNVRFTRKHKSLKDGIEVNEEVEFLASAGEADAAHAFFLSLGYEVYIRKTKRGYAYDWDLGKQFGPLHVELVEVATLGWFLEMEFILDTEEQVPFARTCLLEVLDQLDTPREAIEERYYMHLLKQ